MTLQENLGLYQINIKHWRSSLSNVIKSLLIYETTYMQNNTLTMNLKHYTMSIMKEILKLANFYSLGWMNFVSIKIILTFDRMS